MMQTDFEKKFQKESMRLGLQSQKPLFGGEQPFDEQ